MPHPSVCSEETLRIYFSQFGSIEHAEIMKDRYTGKSRGFGFVTFVDTASATTALSMEHSIDGRRCEAKIALPKVCACCFAAVVYFTNRTQPC